MELTEAQRDFLTTHTAAAMTTLRRDGSPHTVRVACSLMGDVLLSSGTDERLRTRNLRRDPRATLMVFNDQGAYVTVEARVRIIEGEAVPQQTRELFRKMQGLEHAPEDAPIQFAGRAMTPDEFRQYLVDNHRLLYEFEPVRVYGSI